MTTACERVRAAVASPVKLFGNESVTLNLGDVRAVVVERDEALGREARWVHSLNEQISRAPCAERMVERPPGTCGSGPEGSDLWLYGTADAIKAFRALRTKRDEALAEVLMLRQMVDKLYTGVAAYPSVLQGSDEVEKRSLAQQVLDGKQR